MPLSKVAVAHPRGVNATELRTKRRNGFMAVSKY